ncbi:N-6 DNA methylase [Brevibacterium luteolum]|uniref:N-6 DNA methylase n=1 Tax=Brevibacterium luteolum TaxID=199591 RepID=UPI0021AE6AF3|nr:N-6 DNA methylase [Brevibacterium luteolum]MCT1922739.1 N-6 DNA methylase [Brevibacterium luteolum]
MSQNALFTRLADPSASARTEADIQSDIKDLLLNGAFDLDTPRLEEQLADGTRRRIDIAVGATVIEVKKNLLVGALSDYEDQLDGYVRTRTKQQAGRYAGILTDGRRWHLYELDPADDSFQQRSSFELTSGKKGQELVEWLQAVLATQSGIVPQQESIEALLGSKSPAYAQDLAYLRGLYRQLADDPTVQLKRELWARLLRSALGTDFSDTEDLFLDHTLLVTEAVVIGHAVMGIQLADLTADPRKLLRGDAFSDAGIYNAVESDFFDWTLATGEEGRRFLAQVIRRVAVFDWSRTEHDVLKVLYESIIRPETRKGLGEYYTPDWLAEGIVQKTITDPLNQRVLDPSCGSGTFIFHAVRHVLRAADAAGWTAERAVEQVQEHVFGLDIHPVSVVLARITYLLALGDHLTRERGDIWVPVHLGDSMQWHQPPLGHEERISISTEAEDLTLAESSTLFDIGKTLAFPLAGIDDPGTFDQLVQALTDRAKDHTNPHAKHPLVTPILRRFGIAEPDDVAVLTKTFGHLCDLNAEGRDSIWGYFVRNQVRPLWLSMPGRQVDVLVGNPPWVAYRHMTVEMQEQFKSFSEAREQWQGQKLATNEDLVGLFIIRAVELYLKTGGDFGFVTPLAVLSRQTYRPFRSGRWGLFLRADFSELWDLRHVRPTNDLFPVPSAVVFGSREWAEEAAPNSGMPSEKFVVEGMRNKSGWAATQQALTFTPTPNITIDDDGYASPYRETVTQGSTVVPRALFFVEEEGTTSRLGLSSGHVSIRAARSTQEKEPWKSVRTLAGVVERRFVHDTHLGSTILNFRALTPLKAVLPIDHGELLTDKQIADRGGHLAERWDEMVELWETNKNSTNKLSLRERLDYSGGIRTQLNPTKHRVVYSKAGTRLAAARLDDPRQIVDHTLYWIPVTNIDEARYLVAVLNAPVTTEAASVYQSVGLLGARHFDTYVWRLPIPRFDPENPVHQELVEVSAEAETIAAEIDVDGVGFQKGRALVRSALTASGVSRRLDQLVLTFLDPEQPGQADGIE